MKTSLRYAVIFERGERSFGATAPDLPGCFAVAETLEELRVLVAEAMAFHIEGLRASGMPVPNQLHAQSRPLRPRQPEATCGPRRARLTRRTTTSPHYVHQHDLQKIPAR